MSGELLRSLFEAMAFKPVPSLLELADAHVSFEAMGVSQAPEPLIGNALVEGDGIALLVGDTGAGKSSVLAWTAARLADQMTDSKPPRTYLPIFVPVAGRPQDSADIDAFGKATMREVLYALKDGFEGDHRRRIEEAIAGEVSSQHAGARFNVKLLAKVFGAGIEAGFQAAQDVVSLVRETRLDNRGGLRTLGDIMRARDVELVVIVEDTDAWAHSSDGTELARRFFGAVARQLASDIDIGVALAVQAPWTDGRHSLPEVAALMDRAVTCAPVPSPTSDDEAARILEHVLDRRIRRALEDPDSVGVTPTRVVFSEEAFEALAHEFYESGVPRAPLRHIRDTLDRHAGDMPERIEIRHLLDSV